MKFSEVACLTIIGLGTLPMGGCAGKVKVTKVSSIPSGKKLDLDGVFYALPRTVVKVDVPIDRTQFKQGRYDQFKELFFPDLSKSGDASSTDASKAGDSGKPRFSLGKPVISTFGEPDLSKLYYVKLTGWGPVDRTASLDYTEQGTTSGVQGGADNYTTDIILAGISAASGVATRVGKFGSSVELRAASADSCYGVTDPSEVAEDKKVYDYFASKTAEEVFASYCDLKGPSRRGDVRKAVAEATKAPNALLNKATKAYVEIRKLATRRLELVEGNMPAPLPSLEVMLKEIDAAINSAKSGFFTGETKKETWTATFEVRPTSVKDSPSELLTLDEVEGVCLKAPLAGDGQTPKGFTPAGACSAEAAKTIRVRFVLDGNNQIFQRVQEAFNEAGDRSFRYVIPAATLTKIEAIGTKPELVGQAKIMVGQFGAEVSLPASSGGRSLNYGLKFFEATGALKSFTLTSKTAMQGSVVNSISTSTNAILDAKNKQAQAAADKADELNRLERQRKILEDKAKIQQLCVQLQVSCTEE